MRDATCCKQVGGSSSTRGMFLFVTWYGPMILVLASPSIYSLALGRFHRGVKGEVTTVDRLEANISSYFLFFMW